VGMGRFRAGIERIKELIREENYQRKRI